MSRPNFAEDPSLRKYFTEAPTEGRVDTEQPVDTPAQAEAPAEIAVKQKTELEPTELSDADLDAKISSLTAEITAAFRSHDDEAKAKAFDALFPLKQELRRREKERENQADTSAEQTATDMAEAAKEHAAAKAAHEKAFHEKLDAQTKTSKWRETVGRVIERFKDVLENNGISTEDLGLADASAWEDASTAHLEDWRKESITRLEDAMRANVRDPKSIDRAYIDKNIRAKRAINSVVDAIRDYQLALKVDTDSQPEKRAA